MYIDIMAYTVVFLSYFKMGLDLFWLCVIYLLRLPWWLSWQRICLQCRRLGFDPWAGKIPWRKEWQPAPVFLPEEFHGRRCLVDYRPWGHKGSDTTKQLSHSLFTIYLHPHSHWVIITLALNYTTYENRRPIRGKGKGKGKGSICVSTYVPALNWVLLVFLFNLHNRIIKYWVKERQRS